MGPPIKQDPDASTPNFKQDPDSKEALLAALDDDDLYEDAGDLDFSNATTNIWLSRIPRPLWERWSKLDEDEEIQLGTIRIEGPAEDVKRVSLRLHDRPDTHDIPKDYTLQRQTLNTQESASHSTQNTYLFTEKDIPGAENRAVAFGETRSALYESMKRESKKKDRKKKWEPYIRKTVPKRTALVGSVGEEFNCLPIENDEFRRISEQRALDALKPKHEIVFMRKLPAELIRAQNALPGQQAAFVQTTKPVQLRPQENKTTRMPQNELLDLIYQCFREFKYWPFKNLKARLQQPEAYLKQTLEMVAHLVKSGDFAMTWELKPEAMESSYMNALAYGEAKEELPPGTDLDVSEDEPSASAMVTDNEDGQFENV